MSHKSAIVSDRVAAFRGRDLDARFLGFFDCFNRQLFYEAHDVLEDLWLEDRQGPDGNFYKGLIQLAGAFVHLQKQRLPPAAALLKLARANLQSYPATHQQFPVEGALELIAAWLNELAGPAVTVNPLRPDHVPQLVPPGSP